MDVNASTIQVMGLRTRVLTAGEDSRRTPVLLVHGVGGWVGDLTDPRSVGVHHEQCAVAVRVVEEAAEDDFASQAGGGGGRRIGGRRRVRAGMTAGSAAGGPGDRHDREAQSQRTQVHDGHDA